MHSDTRVQRFGRIAVEVCGNRHIGHPRFGWHRMEMHNSKADMHAFEEVLKFSSDETPQNGHSLSNMARRDA